MPSRREFLTTALWAGAGVTLGAGSSKLSAQSSPPDHGAFLAAVAEGAAEIVARLLDAHPTWLALADAGGRSPFVLALLAWHPAVADLLLARGYVPSLHEAALATDWAAFEALAATDPPEVNSLHPLGGSAMYAAAIGGAGSSIWRVYRYGGDPNISGVGGGPSPLRVAFEFPDLAVAELTAATLLANGADAAAAEPEGDSALHAAARLGSAVLVEMLIRKGADPDAKNAQGEHPLEQAVRAGHPAVIATLSASAEIPRDHSSSRDAYDLEGNAYTPPTLGGVPQFERETLVGSSHRDLESVRQRVTADPRLAHSVATTTERAVEACAHTGQLEIVDFLLDHGAPYSLPTALMRGDLARAKVLLAEDPLRIHERAAHDFALLWYPIIGRTEPEVLELVLAAGAEPERQHFLGTTALHWAALGGRIDYAELLLAHGADIDRVGRKFGAAKTPLQLATERDRTEMVNFLKARGAR